MAFDVYGFLKDDSIPDGVKFKVLEKNGYGLRAREALMMFASGRYREHVYERFLRDPAREGIESGATALGGGRFLPTGRLAGKVGRKIARGEVPLVPGVPNDLESAGALAGGIGGMMLGGPAGSAAGTELGGTLGGVAQGRGALESAGRAVPAALMAGVIPTAARYGPGAKSLAHGTSDMLEQRASNATGKLFNRLEVPRRGLRRYFGEQGQGRLSPAMQRAGNRLRGVRTQLSANPNMIVSVPMEMPDHTVQNIEMTYSQAQDMLDRYHQRGWSANQKARDRVLSKPIPGAPAQNVYTARANYIQKQLQAGNARIQVPIGPPGNTQIVGIGPSAAAGVMQRYLNNAKVVPVTPSGAVLPPSDYQLAMETRKNITSAIKKNYGTPQADYYDSLTADYGTAAAMRDVFKKNVSPNDATLSHEALFQNANDPNVSSHIANTAGDPAMRQWMDEMFPQGEARVKAGKPLHVRAGIPITGPHFGALIPAAPVAPPALTPGWPNVLGVIGSQTASQAMENLLGGPQTE